MGPVLILATGNPGKAREVQALLPNVTVETLADHPEVLMPPEDGETFADNARLKAEHVARVLGVPALADDSGLVVEALGGAPGVRSARYAPGSDRDRCLALLAAMAEVPDGARAAHFACAMAFARPGAPTEVTSGRCAGDIGHAMVGEGGFGYDPIFVVRGADGRTMAQHTAAEKNAISHRARALAAMRPHLDAHFLAARAD
jgi:XTP/dITP diphosphohydrolase